MTVDTNNIQKKKTIFCEGCHNKTFLWKAKGDELKPQQ
jgi:hypothetical protein